MNKMGGLIELLLNIGIEKATADTAKKSGKETKLEDICSLMD